MRGPGGSSCEPTERGAACELCLSGGFLAATTPASTRNLRLTFRQLSVIPAVPSLPTCLLTVRAMLFVCCATKTAGLPGIGPRERTQYVQEAPNAVTIATGSGAPAGAGGGKVV